jgi:hypothetical protein
LDLVDSNNRLTDAECEGKKSVFTGLIILGNISSITNNDKNNTIGLRSTSNHVLDEISVTRSINDSVGLRASREQYRWW